VINTARKHSRTNHTPFF